MRQVCEKTASLRSLSGATRQKDPCPSGCDLELCGSACSNTTNRCNCVHHQRIRVAADITFGPGLTFCRTIFDCSDIILSVFNPGGTSSWRHTYQDITNPSR